MTTAVNCLRPALIIIFDRADDPITALSPPWTYQAQLHEHFGIVNNTIDLSTVEDEEEKKSAIPTECRQIRLHATGQNSSSTSGKFKRDEFYCRHLDCDVGELGLRVTQLVTQFKAHVNQQKESVAAPCEDGGTRGLDDIRSFVANYPQFRQMSSTVTRHVVLVSELNKSMARAKADLVRHWESDLFIAAFHGEPTSTQKREKLRGEAFKQLCQVATVLCDEKETITISTKSLRRRREEVMRLLALFTVAFVCRDCIMNTACHSDDDDRNGINFKSKPTLSELNSLAKSTAIDVLDMQRQVNKFARIALQAYSVPPFTSTYRRQGIAAVEKTPLLVHLVQSAVDSLSSVPPGELAFSSLVLQKSSGLDAVKPPASNCTFSLRPGADERIWPLTIVVHCLSGLTYGEVQAVRRLNIRWADKINVICGGSFPKQISDAGENRQASTTMLSARHYATP